MLFLSIGENCLTDDILRRHNIKSFGTPYSSCRSNIYYALALEDVRYAGLLDKNYLVTGLAGNSPVVRSSNIIESDEIFDPYHMKGFEFTHHDPIKNNLHRSSYQRKIDRLDEIRFKSDVCFFYYHRRNKNTNIYLLNKKLANFIDYYKGVENKVFLVLFYQTISDVKENRHLDLISHENFIWEFNFITRAMWGGKNPDLFWGRVDEDLIGEMIKMVKEIIK